MGIIPKDELARKAFHMLILLYALSYKFISAPLTMWIIGAVVLYTIIQESVRLNNVKLNARFLKYFGAFHRHEERRKVSGLTWTLSGAFLTMFLFPDRHIVFASFLFLAFGDSAAAIVGRSIGKRKLLGQKTLEGSLACFVVCFILGLLLFNWQFALIAALIATIVEAIHWPLNDNFWLQIINALALTLLGRFI
ncbi:MAG: hypothetical protein FWC85_00105 [Elusimicrobia bacterium]|nr:hypothetical protein [Elusimicrobiota bacterium]